jgi:hypothetical protein
MTSSSLGSLRTFVRYSFDLASLNFPRNVNANATKVRGTHTLKMGADYRKFYLNFTQLFFPPG